MKWKSECFGGTSSKDHSSTLAWQIPWTEEPDGLQSMGVARSRTRLNDFTFTFHFHALEKEMATHSSVFAWRIPGTGEPGELPSMGSHRVGHHWSNLAAAAVVKNSPANASRPKRHGFNPWRRAWQTTPVFLPEESHGQRSLVGSQRVRHD